MSGPVGAVDKASVAVRPGAQECFFSRVAGLVLCQMRLAHKAFAASLPRADKLSVAAVRAFMQAPGAGLCKGLAAAFIAAGKGFFSCMGVYVSFEVDTLGKLGGAVDPGAGKGFATSTAVQVAIQVVAQTAALGKGCGAAFMRTDKGALAGMAAQVDVHGRPVAALCPAAFIGTGKGAPEAAVTRQAGAGGRRCPSVRVCASRHRAWPGYKALSHEVLHRPWCVLPLSLSGRDPVGQPVPALSCFLADRAVSVPPGGVLMADEAGLQPAGVVSGCR